MLGSVASRMPTAALPSTSATRTRRRVREIRVRIADVTVTEDRELHVCSCTLRQCLVSWISRLATSKLVLLIQDATALSKPSQPDRSQVSLSNATCSLVSDSIDVSLGQ